VETKQNKMKQGNKVTNIMLESQNSDMKITDYYRNYIYILTGK